MILPKAPSSFRSLLESDFNLIRDFIIDSSKSRHDEFEEMDNEAMKKWMDAWLKRVELKEGAFYIWEEDGIIKAWMSFKSSSYADNTLKLSFRFLREHVEFKRRKNLLSEVIHSAFGESQTHRIESVCTADDQESRDLLVLCGMRLEGTIRRALYLRSGWTDLNIYGILEEDLPLENRA